MSAEAPAVRLSRHQVLHGAISRQSFLSEESDSGSEAAPADKAQEHGEDGRRGARDPSVSEADLASTYNDMDWSDAVATAAAAEPPAAQAAPLAAAGSRPARARPDPASPVARAAREPQLPASPAVTMETDPEPSSGAESPLSPASPSARPGFRRQPSVRFTLEPERARRASASAPNKRSTVLRSSEEMACKIGSGTLCYAILPPEAPDDTCLVVFSSCDSKDVLDVLSEGQQVVAAGPPQEIDGCTLVPIRPQGAVDISVLQLEPVRHTRSAPLRRRHSSINIQAALQVQARDNTAASDPIENLPGEEVLATALGMGGAAPGTAVADASVPSSSSTLLPVQVDVTNYRLRLRAPDIGGANLYVMVCCGQGLVAPDRNRPPDPYAAISIVGPQHRSVIHPRQTSVKTKTADPVWNEVFTFQNLSEECVLRVQLFDAGGGRAEEYMGEVQVRKVARLPGGGNSRQWVATLAVQYGDLDVMQGKGAAPSLGMLRLLLRCSLPAPGLTRGHSSIPLLGIEKVALDDKVVVRIATKATERFALHFDTAKDASEVYQILKKEPRGIHRFLCLAGTAMPSPNAKLRFDFRRELERWTTQQATSTRRSSPDGYYSRWRVDSEVNGLYELCPTYPREVVLPAALPIRKLQASAKFRTKHRFPMISWVHPCNGAVLVRCSQPKVGSKMNTHAEAKEDHECLMAFSSGECRELTICDARPYKNAVANVLGGGGTEYSLGYESCNVQFLDIDNIHVMREALHGLRAGVCQQDDYSMYAGALTKWLNHVRSLITGANTAAEMVESGMSVVVHCSDGWDRTSQIVSLASVLLDGYYRTIRGLVDLVQKDWLLPGHKFRDRNGLADRKEQTKHHNESSPIFLQFLDALSQVWSSYPRHFEYTPQLLSFLLYHSLSGRYSNFLGNCQKEREEAFILKKASCVWTEVMDSESEWLNPLYVEELAAQPIVPCVIPLQQYGFCRELYMGFTTWWGDESRPTVAAESHISVGYDFQGPSHANTMLRNTDRRYHGAEQEENGGYIFCSSRLHGAGISRILACELLLRKFMGVASFPAQPIVRVVSHRDHIKYTNFVIEMTSREDDEQHYISKRYKDFRTLNMDLKEQVGLEAPADFPPKTFFGLRCTGRDLEDRLRGLDRWLRSVVESAWVLPEDQDRHAPEAERCCDVWLGRMRSLFAADAANEERQALPTRQVLQRGSHHKSIFDIELTARPSGAA